jgi:hypothetical protein
MEDAIFGSSRPSCLYATALSAWLTSHDKKYCSIICGADGWVKRSADDYGKGIADDAKEESGSCQLLSGGVSVCHEG